jgi:hypothetical protein
MTCTKETTQLISHTPEPWHFETQYDITTISSPDPTGENPYGTYIAEIDGQDVGRYTPTEQHEANARRICAAVNACQGIPTEALESGLIACLASATPKLLEDLSYFLEFAELNDDGEDDDFTRRISAARVAIAQATGRSA